MFGAEVTAKAKVWGQSGACPSQEMVLLSLLEHEFCRREEQR